LICHTTTGSGSADSGSEEKKLQSQLVSLQNQIKQLKVRFGLNQVDKEIYELTMDHLAKQELEIDKELGNGNFKISDLENLLSESLKKLTKLITV